MWSSYRRIKEGDIKCNSVTSPCEGIGFPHNKSCLNFLLPLQSFYNLQIARHSDSGNSLEELVFTSLYFSLSLSPSALLWTHCILLVNINTTKWLAHREHQGSEPSLLVCSRSYLPLPPPSEGEGTIISFFKINGPVLSPSRQLNFIGNCAHTE